MESSEPETAEGIQPISSETKEAEAEKSPSDAGTAATDAADASQTTGAPRSIGFTLRSAEKEAATGSGSCAICFESIEAAGGAVELPCKCTISYCPRCWDRHLASSMAAVGVPRCPSCRLLMRVDYEAETGRLLFTSQEETEGARRIDVFDPKNETRQRLAEQAQPRQMQLLKEYGAAVHRGLTDQLPRCVCNGSLECLNLRDRASKLVDATGYFIYGGKRYSVDELMRIGAITCDLCGCRVAMDMQVWTCENGQNTILHSHSYDICAQCLNDHAFPGPAEPATRPDDATVPADAEKIA